MPDELEALLRLVAEGKITAEEAAPIVAALDVGPRNETRDDARRSARDALAGRRIVVFVAEDGHPVVNLSIPLAAAGFAIDQVPGLSSDHRSRIVEAIQNGARGSILEVSDQGDEVRITIE
jgi:hypothetical protein